MIYLKAEIEDQILCITAVRKIRVIPIEFGAYIELLLNNKIMGLILGLKKQLRDSWPWFKADH